MIYNTKYPNTLYNTLTKAISDAQTNDTLIIGPGRYYEKVTINVPGLTIKGESPSSVTITYDDYARRDHDDGTDYGTFRSYTLLVEADNVTIEDLTIENSAGDGREVGQAIAVYTDADKVVFRNCVMLAHQDTLFCAPLPPSPKVPGSNSFKGPSVNKPYRTLRNYYENCRIVGDIDFIFGSALALFHRCTFVCRNRKEPINSFVFAPSTREEEPYGFIASECHLTCEEGTDDESCYIARPWRPYAKVLLTNTMMDAHIHHNHWDYWGNDANRDTVTFEINNSPISNSFLDLWHEEILRKS